MVGFIQRLEGCFESGIINAANDRRIHFQRLRAVFFYPFIANRNRKPRTGIVVYCGGVFILYHRAGTVDRNAAVDRDVAVLGGKNCIPVGINGRILDRDFAALGVDRLRVRVVQNSIILNCHRACCIDQQGCRSRGVVDVGSVNNDRTAVIGDNILTGTGSHARSIAVHIDSTHVQGRIRIVMQDRARTRDITDALDRALFTGRCIGYSQRAIVADDVGAGIAPIAVSCTGVLLDGMTVQVKLDVLTRLDYQTRDALIGSAHVVVSAISNALFLRLVCHQRIPMIRMICRRMDTELVAVEGVARCVVIELFRAKVLSRIQHLERDVTGQLNCYLFAISRGTIECIAKFPFILNFRRICYCLVHRQGRRR